MTPATVDAPWCAQLRGPEGPHVLVNELPGGGPEAEGPLFFGPGP